MVPTPFAVVFLVFDILPGDFETKPNHQKTRKIQNKSIKNMIVTIQSGIMWKIQFYMSSQRIRTKRKIKAIPTSSAFALMMFYEFHFIYFFFSTISYSPVFSYTQNINAHENNIMLSLLEFDYKNNERHYFL